MSYFDLIHPDYLIVHHTAENVTGPSFVDAPSKKIKNYYSDVGYNNGYKPHGYDKLTGFSDKLKKICPLVDPESGTHVYPMYHASFWKNKNSLTGWAGTLLVKDPLKYNVNALSGKWPDINARSINIHFCGNYEFIDIETPALYTAAATLYNFFKKYNPQIKGHKDFDSTGCPGKIYEKLLLFRELFASETIKRMAAFFKQIIEM
jgi:hypothetical protein